MKKKLIILAVAIIVLGGGVGAYSFYTSQKATKNAQEDPKKQIDDFEKAQKDRQDQNMKDGKNAKSPEGSTLGTQSNEQTNGSSLSKPTVTRLEQAGSGTVAASVIVGNTSSGTCTATFTKGDQKVSKTAEVIRVTSYYACNGFSFNKSEFPSTGAWNFTVQLTSNGQTSTSETKQLEVR